MSVRSLGTASAMSVVALLALTEVAGAHPGHGSGAGFGAGVYHPLSGLDHLLAMIAVGICAPQMGRKATWLLPATFLTFMVGGGLFAAGREPVLMIEQGIAASVLVLGLLVAAGSRVAMAVSLALVALFGVFHGYAHGSEMQAGLSAGAYASGFVLATAALHAVGIGIGLALRRWATLSRVAGGAIAACGLVLLCA